MCGGVGSATIADPHIMEVRTQNGAIAVALCTAWGQVQDPDRKSPSSAHAQGGNACADGGDLHGNQYGVGDDPHKGGPEGRK